MLVGTVDLDDVTELLCAVVELGDGELSGVEMTIDPVPVGRLITVADKATWVLGKALGT